MVGLTGSRLGVGWFLVLVVAALPVGQRVILVVQANEASGQPPLHRSTKHGSTAPAIRIASAFAVRRVVDALENASLHPIDLSALCSNQTGAGSALSSNRASRDGSWSMVIQVRPEPCDPRSAAPQHCAADPLAKSEPEVAAGGDLQCPGWEDVALDEGGQSPVPGLRGDPVEADAGGCGCGGVSGAERVGGDSLGGSPAFRARRRSIRAMASPEIGSRVTTR